MLTDRFYIKPVAQVCEKFKSENYWQMQCKRECKCLGHMIYETYRDIFEEKIVLKQKEGQ